MCKLHDQFHNEHKGTKSRNISDITLAHRAEEISRNPMYDDVDEQQRKDANFIAGILRNKARFGLGLDSSKRKKTSLNDDWNEKLASELHKPVRTHFQRRRVEVKAIDDIWGADLVKMQEWSKKNKGF